MPGRIIALAVLIVDGLFLWKLTPQTSVYGTFYLLGAVVGLLAAAQVVLNLPLLRRGTAFEDSGIDLSRPTDVVGVLIFLGVLTLLPLLLLVHGISQKAILQLHGFAFVFFSREPVRFLLVCGAYLAWIGLGVLLMRKVIRAGHRQPRRGALNARARASRGSRGS